MSQPLTAPDGVESLITVAEAAQHCRVSEATIRSWVQRGKLTRAGRDRAGRNLFRLLDVAKAEHSTRSTVQGRAR